MRIFEQKICEVTAAIKGTAAENYIRPKLILRGGKFLIISITELCPTDLIVCSLGVKDLTKGFSAATWAAIERFIRQNFEWQKQVSAENGGQKN